MAEFKLSRFKYTWKGVWTPFSRYNPDDVVSFGGKVYTSLDTHVADTNFYEDLNFYNGDVPPLLVPKWELTADGVSWEGNWAPDTYYRVGSIVRLGGSSYLCIEAHTSQTPTLDNAADTAFAPDIGKWVLQLETVDWNINWTTETYYKINDIVRYGGRVYRCNTSHESAGNITEGLEVNQSNWDLVSIADDWKGNWSLNTRYKVNDVVRYGGIVYKCELSHTSASSEEAGLPADQGKWSMLEDGISYKGNWEPSTLYKVNDVVKYGGYLYIVNVFHDSGFTFNTPNYNIYCPGQEYDVLWNEVTVYQIGDIVSYGGNLYVSTVLQLNQNPTEFLNAWEPIYQGSKMRGSWSSLTEYVIGDVVRRGGSIYGCLVDNINQDPDFLNDGSTTNSLYWDLIIPGIRWRGVWAPSQTYIAGDTVVWVSSSYRCLDKHISDQGNRPDDDGVIGSTLEGRYWAKITEGNIINRLKNLGDIRTFGDAGDGSTIGFKALAIGSEGAALTVSAQTEAEWEFLQNTANVYYVAEFGQDIPTAGSSPQNPWKTIRYACEQVTGYATIFVRTGDYPEILPITIPAFVAVVGDELRSTTVKPAEAVFSDTYLELILSACDHLSPLISRVIRELPVGDEIDDEDEVLLYGEVSQNFAGTAASSSEVNSLSTLVEIFKNRLENSTSASITSTFPASTNPGNVAANAQIQNNLAFLINELTLYVENTNPLLMPLPNRWSQDLERIISALAYDILYPGNYKTITASTFFINGSDFEQNKKSNMFQMRDGTGLRNMTLIGLEGTLGDLSILGTRRPTAGAYASLDPGYGPSDASAWVGTKSPYVQNVTTFGTGCVGLKIDGDIHAGGNQTIVANDFTQVLSDGIGVWANGTGRSEVVSVFTYYNHIGYLCTNGGKIRGTNGNCSYGTLGAVSEGFNTAESPITAVINNRYFDADVYQTLVSNSGIQRLFFSNAGVNYTTATMTVVGSGTGASVIADEFRDGGVHEIRIANPGDSSAEGGSGYVFITNAAQSGDNQRIQLAGSDENTANIYREMRLIIGRGTGTGQIGYIAEYDSVGKYAYIGKESKPLVSVTNTTSSGMLLTVSSTAHLSINDPVIFTGTKFGNIQDFTVYYVRTIPNNNQITISASTGPGAVFNLINATGTMTMHCVGWEHIVEGTPIESILNSTSNYFIEPRVTFSSPGFTTSSATLPSSRQWSSVAASDEIIVTVALDTNVAAYSINDGTSWNTTTLPSVALWTKVKFVGGVFMAFASNGSAARSLDGISWSSMTMSTTAEWRDVTYGEGKWVAIAAGGTQAAYSTNGTVWTASTLPEGADWNSIEYGRGKFVTTAISDSSISGTATAYSDDGITWTAGTLTQGSYALAYGNNRFVALSGGYAGATEVSISFDGVTWTEYTIQARDWRSIIYAQGIFFAVATGTDIAATSRDGVVWEYQDIGPIGDWCDITYSSINKPGKFIAISGLTVNSTVARVIGTGATTKGRAYIVSGRMAALTILEPGSGYTSPPVMTITDPNNSSEVFTVIRIGNGVIANPTVVDAGSGYETPSTRVTITGDGFKDQYHIGSDIIVSNLTRIPGPGDNLNIAGINDYTYKLLTAEILGGTTGNFTARITIAKDLGREESPEHGTIITIRQLYSQVRLTGHDFLDIGLGNFISTNYPDTLNPVGTVVAPENEIKESNGGRVFYTSTDQDGNFRVGELFAVEQATGTVTLNAQFFELEGLEELRLGGFTVGGSGVVVREFSTEATFTADSNNIVPTQRAIKAYLSSRVSGGGADAITGQITAGIVRVGPDSLETATGEELIFASKVNFRGGVDGTLAALNFFTASGA